MTLIPDYRGPIDPGNIQEPAAASLREAMARAPGLPGGLTIWAGILGGNERLTVETLDKPGRVLLANTDGGTYSTQEASIQSLADPTLLPRYLPVYVEDLRRARRNLPPRPQ